MCKRLLGESRQRLLATVMLATLVVLSPASATLAEEGAQGRGESLTKQCYPSTLGWWSPEPPAGDPTESALLTRQFDTETATFASDAALPQARLEAYVDAFEQHIRPELADILGLMPSDRHLHVEIFGDVANWRRAAGEAQASWSVGFYRAATHSILMVDEAQPGVGLNIILLAHEYTHWLTHEEGQMTFAPSWFDEGLAHNTGWKLGMELQPFRPSDSLVTRSWRYVATETEPVPVLATHLEQDPYIVTAVNYLVETRGWPAFEAFFAATRSCEQFDAAFARAFGSSPQAFEGEYAARIEQARSS